MVWYLMISYDSIAWYCMLLRCWLRRAGCVSQDAYILENTVDTSCKFPEKPVRKPSWPPRQISHHVTQATKCGKVCKSVEKFNKIEKLAKSGKKVRKKVGKELAKKVGETPGLKFKQ